MSNVNHASNFCKVIATEVTTDCNGREYNRVTLEQIQGREEITDPSTGEVFTVIGPQMTVRVTGYKVPYLYAEDDTSAVADYLWSASTGQAIQGCIVRAQVEPYMIGDRTVSTATVFVQGDPNAADFQMRKQQAFDRSGRTLTETETNQPVRVEVPTSSRVSLEI